MLRPTNNNVLLELEDTKQDKTVPGSSLILMPESLKEYYNEDFVLLPVVAVGPGQQLESGVVASMEISPGDVAVLPKFCGAEVKYKDKKYKLVREDEVLAILPKGETNG